MRRHSSEKVMETLKEIGFKEIQEVKLWETRKVYEEKAQLLQDISNRTGRSILHELEEEELQQLVQFIDDSLDTDSMIVEKDRWTIWKAVK